MNTTLYQSGSRRRQGGLTYVEVLIAMALITVALVPALEALHTGMLGTQIYQSTSTEHYGATAKMEELLAEQHSTLLAAAAVAGDHSTPSSFSDVPATANRRLVFLGLYDADNADGDNNVFTVPDANLDGDKNIFTGFAGLIWVRVEIEGSITAFESLSAL